MIQCLINNKICPNTNKKCKNCVFDDCKEVINMEEEQMKYERKDKLNKIKKQLPEQCKNCSFLEIININQGKVRCPYMINRCILK